MRKTRNKWDEKLKSHLDTMQYSDTTQITFWRNEFARKLTMPNPDDKQDFPFRAHMVLGALHGYRFNSRSKDWDENRLTNVFRAIYLLGQQSNEKSIDDLLIEHGIW